MRFMMSTEEKPKDGQTFEVVQQDVSLPDLIFQTVWTNKKA